MLDLSVQSDPARLSGAATLTNTGSDPVHVGAGSPCTIWHWKITDDAGRIVQTPPPTVCTQVLQTQRLDAGGHARKAFEISLTDSAFKPGAAYLLQASFWRHELAARFTAPQK